MAVPWRILLYLALAAYPFVVLLTIDRLGPAPLAALLGLLLIIRWRFFGHAGILTFGTLLVLVLAYAGATLATGDERLLKLYPVFVSLALCWSFLRSLRQPPPLAERLARLAGQSIGPAAAPYLWWVTAAWTAVFALNAAIAGWTALRGSTEAWALYNGFLSYLLMGAVFVVEWIVRHFYKRHVYGPEKS